eukprot:maker-scaffold_6-snap-gene-6.11-mRNA-1 protein AED:0.05 eAED:0.08 QI:0/0/0.33/0.66/0/0/3/53/380
MKSEKHIVQSSKKRGSQLKPNTVLLVESGRPPSLTKLNGLKLKEIKTMYPQWILDGTAAAKSLNEETKNLTRELIVSHNIVPGLATVLLGEKQDSMRYVKTKQKKAKSLGFHSVDVNLSSDTTEEHLLDQIYALNKDPNIHGILVQLPLPKHINESKVLESISIEKDVDGFHAMNIGNLCLRGGSPPKAIPCTPAGVVKLLQKSIPKLAELQQKEIEEEEGDSNTVVDIQIDWSKYKFKGKRALVVGRSNIVGMPMSQLLLSMDCTVTVVHSATSQEDLKDLLSKSDVVVAAVGIAEYIKGSWLKPGALVVDVGINEGKDGGLVGDVQFREAVANGCIVSPVPGGVGPMTIAMLMHNTLGLARMSAGLERMKLREGEYKY